MLRAEEGGGFAIRVSDLDDELEVTEETILWDLDEVFRPATFQEQPALTIPRARPVATEAPPAAEELRAALLGVGGVRQSLLPPERRTQAVGVGKDFVLGPEAKARNATEAGNLLGKSPASLGVVTQKRSPIVNDPRLRGNRIGSMFSSGSYWVPARIDLDTMLSKIDARLIDDIITVNGPYAARYGPGFSFVDFELLPTPRYRDGFEAHGSTSFDYKVNGQGWYGLQTLWGGNADWGFRAAYGHRTGNDYTTGAGSGIPSSYNSRDASIALGRDLGGDRSIEINYLRLDQTGVEFPGQAFDIDVLATDGTEVTYVAEDQPNCDRLEVDAWFNDTRFTGSAQRPGKRRQFPFYDVIDFVGFTEVESLSTGFRAAVSWEGVEEERLTVGADLRYVLQELSEITSGRIGFTIWDEANSPVPKSYFANPGVFAEYVAPVGDCWKVTIGTRGDLVANDVIDDPAKLASLGTQSTPQEPVSLADILGSDDWDRTVGLWSLYATGQYAIADGWTAELAAGYAQRPPTLTELYAAESFMYVLQNGLNVLTGDPRLEPEQLCQIDVGLRYDGGRFHGALRGFHGWAWNYITFENIGITRGPPAGQIEQVQLKYVNTALATLAGGELRGEYDWCEWLTPFATLMYVDGRDRTRNGDFATKPSAPGSPSERLEGLARGAYSGISGAAAEPLPGIAPLESRLGLRFHPPGEASRWSVELSARLVDRQERVATSLLETPTPGFTVWDIRGYWQATDRLLMVAGVENFTDRTYREHLDYRSAQRLQMLQPGVNFYFGSELAY